MLKELYLLWLRLAAPQDLHYINGADTLPPPLPPEQARAALDALTRGQPQARDLLITHNLRLVVYIAKKFETPTAGIEDMISIGTIGLIKAVNTFEPTKNIKLATYASRCIENEILMYLRKSSNRRQDASIDEPLNTDTDGNELLLMDVLTSDDPQVGEELERSAERAALRGAVGRLSPRERRIMELRFGLNHETEHTQKEVPELYFPARKAHHPPPAPGAGGSGIKNLQPRRGRACPARGLPVSRSPRKAAGRTCAASTGQCLLHHRLRPGIRHKLHRQPGNHVHLGLQRVQQVLVPLPRPRYTGDAPGVLALGHGDTVNVVLLYILKCQVKKAGGVKHLPGPGRAQAHAAARHNVVVDLRDLPLNEPVAVGHDDFIAGRGRDAEPAGLPIVGL